MASARYTGAYHFLRGRDDAIRGIGRRFSARQPLALSDQLLQDWHVDDLDRTARHHHQSFLLKFREEGNVIEMGRKKCVELRDFSFEI